MRLTGDPAPGAMSSSGGSGNFLLVPIPEYPLLDCVPNKTVKIVVLGASNVGKTGRNDCKWREEKRKEGFPSTLRFNSLWRIKQRKERLRLDLMNLLSDNHSIISVIITEYQIYK